MMAWRSQEGHESSGSVLSGTTPRPASPLEGLQSHINDLQMSYSLTVMEPGLFGESSEGESGPAAPQAAAPGPSLPSEGAEGAQKEGEGACSGSAYGQEPPRAPRGASTESLAGQLAGLRRKSALRRSV